jgi:hypothetical protein
VELHILLGEETMSRRLETKFCLAIIWLLLAVFSAAAAAKTIYVDDDGPADFNNIQAAIDDSNDGDTIIVAEGIYYENINFKGRNIALRSTDPNNPSIVTNTIIDGGQKGMVVSFLNSEDPNCVLSGFTITNGGWCGSLECAGIACYHSSPTISHNMITGNWGGEWGGGIYCGDNSSPLIIHNTIRNNYSEFSGGIDCWDNSSPRIIKNKIFGNYADAGMGAIHIACSSSIILNNLIALNFGAGIGISGSGKQTTILNNTIVGTLPSIYEHAGIGVYVSVSPMIRNCIIWENEDDLKGCSATYSCIQDEDIGEGNIFSDPMFVLTGRWDDAGTPYISDDIWTDGDYHLKSQAGRWDANEGRWAIDEVTSLCIDAGDPASPIGLEPFPNGGIINMGAYGGTAEASKSYFGEPICETIVAGDINGDCKVDFKDFAIMAFHWLEEH